MGKRKTNEKSKVNVGWGTIRKSKKKRTKTRMKKMYKYENDAMVQVKLVNFAQ